MPLFPTEITKMPRTELKLYKIAPISVENYKNAPDRINISILPHFVFFFFSLNSSLLDRHQFIINEREKRSIFGVHTTCKHL